MVQDLAPWRGQEPGFGSTQLGGSFCVCDVFCYCTCCTIGFSKPKTVSEKLTLSVSICGKVCIILLFPHAICAVAWSLKVFVTFVPIGL